jgi:hypothetical protein
MTLSLEVRVLLTENYDRVASVEGPPGISITIHTYVPGIGKYNTRLSIIVPIMNIHVRHSITPCVAVLPGGSASARAFAVL